MKIRIAPLVLAAIVSASTANAAQKIGYIDSEALREKLPEFKNIQRQLERLRQQYEQQAMDRQSKLMKLQDDFRKQELLMSEARKAEMQAQFEENVQQLQQFSEEKLGPNGELMRKNIELSSPIFEMVNAALEVIAKEQGYDFIFDVAGGGAIVFADPDRYNLTEDLLDRLEKDREEKEKGQQ